MADGTLRISMSPQTLNALKANGSRLYIFRQVVSSNLSGAPLVWARQDNYLGQINLQVPGTLSGYVSDGAIAPNGGVGIGAFAQADPGQTLRLTADGAVGVETGAPSGVIYMVSEAASTYVCGLAAGPSPVPFCAFELLPQSLVAITPQDAVCVMFATSVYEPGVYMTAALGPAVLVRFDGVADRQIAYEVASGWTPPAGATWATTVPAGSDLAQVLIVRPRINQAKAVRPTIRRPL